MNPILTVIIFILLRFVLPIILLVALSATARHFYKRWQDEAARAPRETVPGESQQDAKLPVHP
jgi:hypothetical protein